MVYEPRPPQPSTRNHSRSAGLRTPIAPRSNNVRVNHRRAHVPVPEQFLHRADVVPVLKQVRRKRMPERVTTRALAQSSPPNRRPEHPRT